MIGEGTIVWVCLPNNTVQQGSLFKVVNGKTIVKINGSDNEYYKEQVHLIKEEAIAYTKKKIEEEIYKHKDHINRLEIQTAKLE